MKKEALKFAFLLLVAIGAGPVFGSVWQWSKTPSSNGIADPAINWSTGMSPSSIDVSSRSEMARIAEWRDDISGALVLTGGPTSFTLTTNASSSAGQGLCAGAVALTDGQMVAFRVNVANGAAATLTVDGCSAYAFQSAAGTALGAGALVAGAPYRASYNLANMSWVVEGTANATFNIPIGGMIPYAGTTAPNSSFLLANGQCVSQTTYSTLYTLMGSPGVGSCSAGNFNLPDTRGNAVAGMDTMGGTTASRLTAGGGCGTAMTTIGAQCASGVQNRTLTQSYLPLFTPTGSISLNVGASGTAATNYYPINTTANNFSVLIPVGGNAITLPLTITNATYNWTQTATYGSASPAALPTVQPTVAMSYIIRVL